MSKKKKLEQQIKYFLSDLKNMDIDQTKNILFLFGAGFNFNISDNAISWEQLTSNAIFSFIKNKKSKNYFEAQAVSEKLIKVISNNKLLLEIPDSVNINNINLSNSNLRFKIRKDLEQLMNKFSVTIYTLNYDNLLEVLLRKPSNNLLIEGSSPKLNSINHLHGVIDENGDVSDPKLMTLNDYVNNQDKVTKILKDNFFSIKKENKTQQYLFIFGTSMQEEHILKALKTNTQNKGKLKIIWFNFFPQEKYIFEPISKIYKSLNIHIINCNVYPEKTNVENLGIVWNILFNYLLDDKVIKPEFSLISNLNPYKLRNIKDDELKDNIIEDILSDEGIENITRPMLTNIIRELYVQEKISIDNIWELKSKYLNKLNISFLFGKNIKYNDSFKLYLSKLNEEIAKCTYSHNAFFIQEAIKLITKTQIETKFLSENKNKELAEMFIIDELISSRRNDYPIDLYQNSNLNIGYILKNVFRLGKMPKENIYKNFIKLLESNFDKEPLLKKYKTPSIKNLENILLNFDYGISFLILKTKRWNNFIGKSFELICNKYFSLDKANVLKYQLFILMYIHYYQSEQWKEKYEDFINTQKDFIKYPSSINIIGHGGSFEYKYFAIDGNYIETNNTFKTIEEGMKFLESKQGNDDQYKIDFLRRVKTVKIPDDFNEKREFVKKNNKGMKNIGQFYSLYFYERKFSFQFAFR